MPKIVGSREFIVRTNKAIALLKRRAPASMSYINTIQTIYEETYSGVEAASAHGLDARVPTRYLKHALEAYAATLVHEGGHVHLLRIGQQSWGTEAERFCFGIQIEALRKMGGARRLIAFLEKHHRNPTHHLKRSVRVVYHNGFRMILELDGTLRMAYK